MALTLTVPAGTFHLSGNPLWIKVEGAGAPAGSSSYKVLLKVTSVDGDLTGGPFVDGKAPADGVAWFDVSGYVDQPIQKTFEWVMAGGLSPHTGDTLSVKFTPGESYIDAENNLVESWGSDSEIHYVLKGGVGPRRLGYYHDQGSSFYTDFVTGGKFLTWMPASQTVSPFQPVKLWLLAASSGSADLHIKAFFEDNTVYDKVSSPVFYKDILHEINCLPYHADSVNMPPVKAGGIRMTHYQVWVEGVTETRSFVIDHSYHENNNFLLVMNSLGGVDVIWLSGEVVAGFETQSVEAVRPFPMKGTIRERTVILASRTGRRTWKINSGWKPKSEIEALSDALLSKQAWLLLEAGSYNAGTLVPVNVASGSTRLFGSVNDLQSVDIEMVEGHDSQYR